MDHSARDGHWDGHIAIQPAAKLARITAAPHEELARGGYRRTVVVTAGNSGYINACQSGDSVEYSAGEEVSQTQLALII